MPDLLRLLGQGLDQMGMRMPERIDRNTGGEIEVALTLGRIQPCAFAPLESEVDPCIGWQQMRAHGQLLPSTIFVFA